MVSACRYRASAFFPLTKVAISRLLLPYNFQRPQIQSSLLPFIRMVKSPTLDAENQYEKQEPILLLTALLVMMALGAYKAKQSLYCQECEDAKV